MLHLVKEVCWKNIWNYNIVWLWANLGNWTIFNVFDAIVIVAGLYLVSWGKSQDQPAGSKSGGEKVRPTAQNMATMNEGIMTSNQVVMAINVTSTKFLDGTASK